MANDLWPDFGSLPRVRSVRRVLVEAGKGLAEKTRGLVNLEIESAPKGKGQFTHVGLLVVPALDYRFPLFRAEENGDPYPVTIYGDSTFQKGTPAANEGGLVENLRLLF